MKNKFLPLDLPNEKEKMMNRNQIIAAIIMVDFLALSGFAVWQHGYIGVFEAALQSWGSALFFTDLAICLGLGVVWMFHDAREKDINPWPYAIAALLIGSPGLLAYIIKRESRTQSLPNLSVAMP